MSNAVTISQLQKLAKSLSATPQKLERGLANAAAEIGKLVAGEFASGTNPWGRAWPAPQDGGSPLRRTGRLASSVTVESTGKGFVARAGASYAQYLQRGSKVHALARATQKRGRVAGLAPRSIVPVKKLPPTWQLSIVQALTDELGDVT